MAPKSERLSLQDLARYRIWDSFTLPSPTSADGSKEPAIETIFRHIDRFGIERISPYFHIGMGTLGSTRENPEVENPKRILRCLERWPDRLLGFIMLNPHDPKGCIENIDRWIRDGPMVGIVFQDAPPAGLVCSHPNHDPIVRRAHELGAVIMHYTWLYTGGKRNAAESFPADLAELAKRHPEITFVCSHAGGEWENGIRSIYDCANIVVETSGFDPTSGFVDMAVRELGARRIIFGSHLPSRSMGTELSKVLGAGISDEDRHLVFGENLRRMLKPLFTRQGRSQNPI